MTDLWKAHKEHGLDDRGEGRPSCVEFVSPDGWWAADVRFDGCVNLVNMINTPLKEGQDYGDLADDNVQGMHICDLPDLMERLQALLLEADYVIT